MKEVKQKENILWKGILSGIYVGIAGTVYLTIMKTTGNKVLGGLLFSFALITIVKKNYALYTGRIGYLLPYKKGYALEMLKVIGANLIGVATTGLLIRYSGLTGIVETSTTVLNSKLDYSWYEMFILSVFCGILMYTAVDGSKKIKSEISQMLLIIGAVVIFLVADFQHSIANMFYLFVGNAWSWKLILYIIIMVLGNAVGGILINLMHHRIEKTENK